MAFRELMYREALREAIDEEMARAPEVFIIGEGIAERGGSYKVTEGLLAKYGPKRVRDTPIAEAGMIGVGVGAAIAGARPIVEILYVDFAMLGMDMIVNQAAKFRLMTGGHGRVPFVLRTQGGAGGGVAAVAVCAAADGDGGGDCRGGECAAQALHLSLHHGRHWADP